MADVLAQVLLQVQFLRFIALGEHGSFVEELDHGSLLRGTPPIDLSIMIKDERSLWLPLADTLLGVTAIRSCGAIRVQLGQLRHTPHQSFGRVGGRSLL